MTENEAIKIGKDLYENITSYATNIIPTKRYIEFIEMAIKALEEIQQYRAIGTVDELKALKEKNMAKKQGNINDFDSHLRLSKVGFLCCSSTNKEIRYPLISLRDLEYCPRCGQKLDWE